MTTPNLTIPPRNDRDRGIDTFSALDTILYREICDLRTIADATLVDDTRESITTRADQLDKVLEWRQSVSPNDGYLAVIRNLLDKVYAKLTPPEPTITGYRLERQHVSTATTDVWLTIQTSTDYGEAHRALQKSKNASYRHRISAALA